MDSSRSNSNHPLFPKSSNPNFHPNSSSNSVIHSPNLTPVDVNSINKRRKKKPVIQRNPSATNAASSNHYIYSVDDDLDEIEKDLEREYFEGFNDALRYRFKKSNKNLRQDTTELAKQTVNSLTAADNNLRKLEAKDLDNHSHHVYKHHNLYANLNEQSLDDNEAAPSNGSQYQQPSVTNSDINLNRFENQIESNDNPGDTDEVFQSNGDDEHNNVDDQDGEGDELNFNNHDDDADSINSLESYTLKERQNAINVTHPFGIRIWKPALYKKTRSVEREADQDIHEIDFSIKKHINWAVHITNLFWSLTFGLFLLILNLIGAVILTLLGSLEYARVFFNLGLYLLWPFGKIVYLQKDKNYLDEDRDEGTTLHEYQRWRDEEQHKLFFSPSSHDVTSIGNNSSNTAPQAKAPQQAPTLHQQISRNSVYTQREQNQSIDSHLSDEEDTKKKRFFGRGDWNLGRIIFYVYYYLVLQPVFWIIWLVLWLFVVTIPMSKVLSILTDHLRRHPLAVFFKFDSYLLPPSINTAQRMKNSNILVCTYRSSGLHYLKYTVDGTNIFIINLLFIVIFTIFDFYILKEVLHLDNSIITNESVIFALCLLSIVPLAYFIGQAVASISAQSSMGVGAVINAFFSTVVEIYLYCVALNQKKGLLVEGSMIGSILGAVLLLPGLSMCAGAFIRKTQRYNPASAGVSSTMLLFSISVMFAPTVFHQIYGTYEIRCLPCTSSIASKSSCQTCRFLQPPLTVDNLFTSALKPFSIVCAVLLFLAYTIGLWFTLRTHAALIWQTPITEPNIKPKTSSTPIENVEASQIVVEQQGHEAPNWSKYKSTVVLLGATLLYAIIAEILVDCVDSVLKAFPINPKFLGITIFALVPNTTEFLNAISFATHGNVALSMEIGSAYALQVCLIQIPSLVLYSLFFTKDSDGLNIRDSMFTLIFPNWDLVASFVSVVLFTYIYAEGKSNYFKGSILILIYVVVLCGFWFTGIIESHNGGFINGMSYQTFNILT